MHPTRTRRPPSPPTHAHTHPPTLSAGEAVRPEELEDTGPEEKQETDRNMEEMWKVLAAENGRCGLRAPAGNAAAGHRLPGEGHADSCMLPILPTPGAQTRSPPPPARVPDRPADFLPAR